MINTILDISENEKIKGKVSETIQSVKSNVEKLIPTGENAKHFLQKAVIILSKLGVYGLFNGVNGVPQLIADLYELIDKGEG